MSNTLSTLSDFVDREAAGFKARLVNEGNTIELATVQTGVAYKATINSVYGDGNFQYGECVGGAADSANATTSSFDARELTACKHTLYDSICMNEVAEKFDSLAGDERSESALRALAEGAVSSLQKQVEINLWNKDGVSICGSTDGLYSFISGSDVASVTSPTTPTGSAANVFAAVNEVYEAIPDAASNKDGLGIFMGLDVWKRFLGYLMTDGGSALGGYNVRSTANGALTYIDHPTAPNVRVIGTMGLTGTNRIVGGPVKDIVVGTSLSPSDLGFQLWYSIEDDTVKYRVNGKFGANIANPSLWVGNDLD
jgi:hypothetical protein